MTQASVQSIAIRYQQAKQAAQNAVQQWLLRLPQHAIEADSYACKYELLHSQPMGNGLTGGRMQVYADAVHVLGLYAGKYARTGVMADLKQAAEYCAESQRAISMDEKSLLNQARNIAFRSFFAHLGLDPEAIMAENVRQLH